MPNITINNINFTYTLAYSERRKTICLKVVKPEVIEVIVPKKNLNFDVEIILRKKFDWLKKHSDALRTIAETSLNSAIYDGASILFLGQPYILKIIQTVAECCVTLNDNLILVKLPANLPMESNCTAVLESWYKKNAADILIDKTRYWSTRLGVSPTKINIKNQKTRWGSCSSRGSLNYNWRIVMAPPAVINYLVIHELSHLIVPNHSGDFWKLVEKHCPNFKMNRNWLKVNGQLLMRFP
ncbi:MAG: M48 family metallopeptidase [Veillonellaceae bacterium]|jgi:predicted metal-dependent hydrolase|nr:M48 family metallopeptidase [Veillonellaceae bacterium]